MTSNLFSPVTAVQFQGRLNAIHDTLTSRFKLLCADGTVEWKVVRYLKDVARLVFSKLPFTRSVFESPADFQRVAENIYRFVFRSVEGFVKQGQTFSPDEKFLQDAERLDQAIVRRASVGNPKIHQLQNFVHNCVLLNFFTPFEIQSMPKAQKLEAGLQELHQTLLSQAHSREIALQWLLIYLDRSTDVMQSELDYKI